MTGSGATPSGQETCDLRDEKGNYLGKVGTSAEHRTVGDYRAWCHDCGEWCYPTSPCGEPKCCAELPTPPAPAQDAGSGRQAAVEAVARELSSNVAFFWGVSVGIDYAKLPEFWTEVATVAVAALSQPGEPT